MSDIIPNTIHVSAHRTVALVAQLRMYPKSVALAHLTNVPTIGTTNNPTEKGHVLASLVDKNLETFRMQFAYFFMLFFDNHV